MIDPKQGPLYLPHYRRVRALEAAPLGLDVRMDMDNVLLCFTARDGSCVEMSVEHLAWDYEGPVRRTLLSWCDDRRSDCRNQDLTAYPESVPA
jgi:hypothetical protein